ncbi:MAG TPA: class I SAM-dependent methyltransferase [Gaiellaceae bacterium]
MTFGQRFARIVTDAVVRWPALWRILRLPMRAQFDKLAPVWEGIRMSDTLAPVEAGLDALASPPHRVLDLGTGTGAVARLVAERFPEAEVVGADIATQMIEEARRITDSPRITYQVADAQKLPFGDGAFDLVTLGNMIPFFDELARIVAPSGHVLIAYSAGDETPIYVPPERLRAELGRRGFAEFAELSAGRGASLLAVKS